MGSYGFFNDMPATLEDDLDYAYQSAPETVDRGGDLPDGNYQGFIEEAMLKENKKVPGAFGLFFKIVVISDHFAGRRVTKYTNIDIYDPEATMRRIKPDLMCVGFDWAGIRSLDDQERYSKILDTIIDFRVTHKTSQTTGKTYQNIWFNRAVGVADAAMLEKYGIR